MSIEGEQLVFDYLSKVGDLARGTSMSVAERTALVGRVRAEIGERRAAAGGAESRAQIRRILGTVGRPEDVVAAAAEASGGGMAVPAPRPAADAAGTGAPRARATAERPAVADDPRAPGAPGGAGDLDELDKLDELDDRYWPDGQIGGFVGGIDAELLRPPREDEDHEARDAEDTAAGARDEDEGDEGDTAGGAAGDTARGTPAKPAARRSRRWRKRVRRALGTRRAGGPVELLAVVLLTAGALLASLYALVLGWLLSYWSPRLSRRQAQWATFGAPGVLVGGYVVWLVGRTNGYWGARLAEGGAEEAIGDNWAWLLRGAALASAALLFALARRHRPPAAED